MKNKLLYIIQSKISVVLDIIISLLINIFFKCINKKSSSAFILVYAPYKGDPWILNKVINDIKLSSSKSENYKIFTSLIKLSIFRLNNGGKVFSMHQSNIRKLFFSGISLNEINTFYTHSRLNQEGIRHIKKIRKIFCQNIYELSLLNASGVNKNKLVNFPIGLHQNFIKNQKNIRNLDKREIDILFCLRYYRGNYHYSIRKRYEFIVNLSNLLSEMDLKVCILGKGWNEKKFFLSDKILLKEVKFSDYSGFYRNSKIYCNPSICEGGPISLIEAYASGCFIYTSPVGLSFNYCLEDELSCIMSFDRSEEYWKKSILKSLKENLQNNYYKKVLSKRYEKLKGSTFKSLSEVLEKNLV